MRGFFRPEKQKKPVLAAALELTPRCTADCLYCYNVWKSHPDYPAGELQDDGIFRVMDALLASNRVTLVSLTGGEPLLLGEKVLELAAMARLAGKGVNLVTNGYLLTRDLAKNFRRLGVKPIEITLLSRDPGVHNKLQRCDSHARAVQAVEMVAELGGQPIVGIVGTRLNMPRLADTLEFVKGLGARGVMFTRFNPGGEGLRHWQELAPSKRDLREAMKTLISFAAANPEMSISCGVPMPPCVLGFTDYGRVSMGYCNAGGDLVGVDWRGNLRPCNHSSLITGNILEKPLDDLLESKVLKDFMAPVPQMCVGCQFYEQCKGGCRGASWELAWFLRQEKAGKSKAKKA